jgi:zinc protease
MTMILATACHDPSPGATRGSRSAGGSDPAAGGEAGGEREPLGKTGLIAQPSDTPVIDFRVAFDAGSAADPEGQEGVTRLAARLMVEGGAGELDYQTLTERLYPMAGSIDAYTGRDQTVFVGRVHRDHLEAFYDLFRSVLLEPRMGERDFERVRSRAQNALTLELRGSDDEALGKAALQGMLYESHPYAHPPLGTEASLASLTVAQAQAQRRRVFCAGRAIVGVAGGFPEGFAARVKRDVEALAFEECEGRQVLPSPPEVQAPRILLVDKDEASSVAMSLGLHTEVRRDHPDYPALVLAAAYFGQHRQFVGRLMQAMRGERGLNYGDYAYATHFEQEGWSRFPRPNIARRQQYFSMWIRPVRLEQAHFALRMAVRELHRFVETGLSEEDFERVRRFVDRYYTLYLQTASRRLGFAIDDRFYGRDEPWLEHLRATWKELDSGAVNEAVRRHVDPERLQVALVHPEAEAFAATLASETPSPIDYPAPPSARVREEDAEIISYPVGIPRSRMKVVPVDELFAGAASGSSERPRK